MHGEALPPLGPPTPFPRTVEALGRNPHNISLVPWGPLLPRAMGGAVAEERFPTLLRHRRVTSRTAAVSIATL